MNSETIGDLPLQSFVDLFQSATQKQTIYNIQEFTKNSYRRVLNLSSLYTGRMNRW